MRSKTHVGQEKQLEELLVKIKASHEECLKALRAAVPHARKTGTYLLEAKKLVEPGKWLQWVQENCAFSVAESQRYMRLADNYNVLKKKCEDPSKLTLTEALRLLSAREDKPANDREEEDKRLPVTSLMEVKERRLEAQEVRFTKDSPEEKFVREKVASIARQVLQLARKTKVKAADGDAVDAVKVAIALVWQLKKALKSALVVRVTEEKPATAKASKVKPESNGYKPVNRLNGNGKATATIR